MNHEIDSNVYRASIIGDQAVDDVMNERVCGNCCYFFHQYDDDSLGICSLDEDFAPYWDDEQLMEQMDFTCCLAGGDS